MNGPIPGSNPDSSTATADPSGRQLVIHVKNAVDRYQKILEHGLPKGLPKGLSTGFSQLDEMCHGLEPGRIYLIASRPSLGKTTLLLNILAATAPQSRSSQAHQHPRHDQVLWSPRSNLGFGGNQGITH